MSNTPTAAGSPATIVDPNGELDALAIGTNGHLYQYFRPPSTGIWGAVDLTSMSNTPTAAGSPATIVDPNGELDALAIGTNGHLYQYFRPPSTGIWGAVDLTSMSNTPSAAGSPATIVESERGA